MPRPLNRTVMLPMRVWDAATRLFHWTLVLLVAAAWFCAETGRFRLHILCGLGVLTLLVFRIVWGFIGSETARFSRFLANPAKAIHHLAHFAERGPDTEVGHNAAGGWMVLVLLALLAVQVTSGLFNSGGFDNPPGPLAGHVSDSLADLANRIHGLAFTVLLAAIGLHILAVFAYALVKRHDLVRPMITGTKRLPAATRQPRMASPLLALVVFLLALGAVWLLRTLA